MNNIKTENISKYKMMLIISCIISISFFNLFAEEAVTSSEPMRLSWSKLRRLKVPSKVPASVKKLNGKLVKIHGYMVPLNSDKKGLREFLLVPGKGMCIHVPPPPPNQMIFVKMMKDSAQHTWDLTRVVGKLLVSNTTNQYGYAFYTIEAIEVE